MTSEAMCSTLRHRRLRARVEITDLVRSAVILTRKRCARAEWRPPRAAAQSMAVSVGPTECLDARGYSGSVSSSFQGNRLHCSRNVSLTLLDTVMHTITRCSSVFFFVTSNRSVRRIRIGNQRARLEREIVRLELLGEDPASAPPRRSRFLPRSPGELPQFWRREPGLEVLDYSQ